MITLVVFYWVAAGFVSYGVYLGPEHDDVHAFLFCLLLGGLLLPFELIFQLLHHES